MTKPVARTQRQILESIEASLFTLSQHQSIMVQRTRNSGERFAAVESSSKALLGCFRQIMPYITATAGNCIETKNKLSALVETHNDAQQALLSHIEALGLLGNRRDAQMVRLIDLERRLLDGLNVYFAKGQPPTLYPYAAEPCDRMSPR